MNSVSVSVENFLVSGGRKYVRLGNGNINCECPFCHEGSSRGVKKRFYWLREIGVLYCHNCGYSKGEKSFLRDVSATPGIGVKFDVEWGALEEPEKKEWSLNLDLPKDSVDLFSILNFDTFYAKAFDYLKKRKIVEAVNRPKSIFISKTDKIHKNRIIIPFYNRDGKPEYYQTRAFLEEDEKNSPKYLSKMGSEKCLFGLDKIDDDIPYLFLFEGPIDAMFCRNGLAMAGVTLNNKQNLQLSEFFFHRKIFVLDNQWVDETSKKVSIQILKQHNEVFIWPKNLVHKDFNILCSSLNKNEIPVQFVLDNTFSGMTGLMKLSS